MPARSRRLTFRLEHLEPVMSGSKRATVRFSQAAAAARPGDALALAFGRYDRPTVFQAVVRRVEAVGLEPELRRAYTLPENVLTPAAERAFDRTPPRPDEATPQALLEALRDSGGLYPDVLAEAAARGATHCTCVWFELEPAGQDLPPV